jgi:uncharacterized damage-inducible protein DinB
MAPAGEYRYNPLRRTFMPLSHTLLPEFDQEMAHARKSLERVPEDKMAWKPHEKSMTMAQLATHLAEIPGWGTITMEQESFDMAPPGAPPYQPAILNSRQAILELFDKNVSSAREILSKTTDDRFMRRWTLLMGGAQIFSMPRIAVVRSMIMNHLIHHRAQLGVYLRMNDIPLPAIYGPSADDNGEPADTKTAAG